LNDIADFAIKVATALADFVTFLWDMLSGWDCK
jgi:hypothetical protein